jgi:hypothetical protein
MNTQDTRLIRNTIVAALVALDAECVRREIVGEICIYGGAEMVLVFDAREATRDVDAVLRPKTELLEAARVVADQLNLPVTWLNEGVKGFLSHHEEFRDDPLPGLEELSHLRIFAATPEYLLAMKCVAARSAETSEDRRDVEFLIRSLGLATEQEVFDIVGRFYPLDHLHVRSRYFVGEILSGIAEQNGSGATLV